MTSTLRYTFVALVVVALLASSVIASNSRPPRNNDISNMADALKYLQDLDTYYGDRARVRFGKRAYWTQLMRNHLAGGDNPEVVRTIEYPTAVDEPF